jgi:hypothetical protein
MGRAATAVIRRPISSALAAAESRNRLTNFGGAAVAAIGVSPNAQNATPRACGYGGPVGDAPRSNGYPL